MSQPINCKIDVTLIDKARLFKGSKPNKKNLSPQYLDVVLIPKETEFSDYMIVQSVTKEERDKGVRGEILGNGKVFTRPTQTQQRHERRPAPPAADNADQDCPF